MGAADDREKTLFILERVALISSTAAGNHWVGNPAPSNPAEGSPAEDSPAGGSLAVDNRAAGSSADAVRLRGCDSGSSVGGIPAEVADIGHAGSPEAGALDAVRMIRFVLGSLGIEVGH